MLKVSQQQIDNKWDILPMSLKKILCSFEYGQIIWQIGAEHHLTEEKIGKVVGIAGYAVYGFIHLEDLAKEIKETLGLNSEIAVSIADEINKKIFTPIKNDIDAVYAPPAVIKEMISREPLLNLREVEIKKDVVDLKIFEKKKLEEEIKKSVEIIKEIKKELPIVPLPVGIIKKAVLPAEILAEEGPMIIHKEIENKPILGKQRSLGGLFGFLKTQKEMEKIQEQKPITAEVEMPVGVTDNLKPTTNDIVIEPSKPPKVVHYSDLKTPISKPITYKQQQITAIKLTEMPMPPKPEIKSEIKSKIFESEIEKAKASGLIINNQSKVAVSPSVTPQGKQPAFNNQQFNIEEIPIEIEEIPRQNFFSKVIQFLIGLFVTKKKVIKEIKEEISIPLPSMPPKSEKTKEFEFPIEIKLPEPRSIHQPAELQGMPFKPALNHAEEKGPELPKIAMFDLKADIFKTKELEPPEIHEAREKPQQIIPKPEELKTDDEEIIDLRTFQRIKK